MMELKTARTCIATVMLVLASNSLVRSQEGHDSHSSAQQILQACLDAFAGGKGFEDIQDIKIEYMGNRQLSMQGRSHTKPFDFVLVKGSHAIDTKRGYEASLVDGRLPGGIRLITKNIEKDGKLIRVDVSGSRTARQASPNPLQDMVGRVPHIWLENILAEERPLQLIGKEQLDDREHAVIALRDKIGVPYQLYFDVETKLLSKYSIHLPHPDFGEFNLEVVYPGFRRVQGRLFPAGLRVHFGGSLWMDMLFTKIGVNEGLAESEFEIPEDCTMYTPLSKPEIKKLGSNVYVIKDISTNLYNGIFLAVDDYVVVFDAIVASSVSQRVIDLIKETLPGKRIKYVVISHHHIDHSLGLSAFAKEGATFLSAPANKDFLEQRLAIQRQLAPEIPEVVPIETVLGKRALGDGESSCLVYNMGNTSHVDGMLVVYVPAAKTVIQGDLLTVQREPGDIPPAFDITREFARWLRTENLAVEHIVGIHGRIATAADLREALGKPTIWERWHER